MRTLYRIFKRSKDLDVTSLPMKGKRHPNGYVERRGKAGRLGRLFRNDIRTIPTTIMNLDILKLIRSKVKTIVVQ